MRATPALLLGAFVAAESSSLRAANHWNNWIYQREPHHWHSLWCRWTPSGEAVHSCHAERIFEPTEDGNR